MRGTRHAGLLARAKDGSLLVSEDGAGTLCRVTRQGRNDRRAGRTELVRSGLRRFASTAQGTRTPAASRFVGLDSSSGLLRRGPVRKLT